MEVKIRAVNGKYIYSDLCGTVFYKNGIKCTIDYYDAESGKIHILIDQHGNELYMTMEAISMAFGQDDFIKRMKENYDLDIASDEMPALYNGDIVGEAMKLRDLGFDTVEIIDGKIVAKSSEDPDMILDVTKKMRSGMETAVPLTQRSGPVSVKLEDMYKHLLY